MSLDTLKNRLPETAKDIKLNLSSLANETTLTDKQLWGVYLASALASRNATVIQDIMDEAKDILPDDYVAAIKAANAIMGMNNVYYRWFSLTSDSEYKTMPAGLRMNILANPGIDKGDFEAFELAVSVINACKTCVQAHEAGLAKEGFGKKEIQTIVRIASVVHAAACVVSAEEALSATNSVAEVA